MEMKIWEMEYAFIEAFDKAILEISREHKTLREVLAYGFNSVCIYDETTNMYIWGYDLFDFDENLDRRVAYCYYDTDEDGFRIVNLKFVN